MPNDMAIAIDQERRRCQLYIAEGMGQCRIRIQCDRVRQSFVVGHCQYVIWRVITHRDGDDDQALVRIAVMQFDPVWDFFDATWAIGGPESQYCRFALPVTGLNRLPFDGREADIRRFDCTLGLPNHSCREKTEAC